MSASSPSISALVTALVTALLLATSAGAQEHEHAPADRAAADRATDPDSDTRSYEAHGTHEGHEARGTREGQDVHGTHEGHEAHGTREGQDAHGTHEGHEAHGAPSQPSEPGASEREHVPPDPPAHEMHDMPYDAMVEMMAMDDTDPFSRVLFDQLDWRDGDGADVFAWDAEAWYGGDYHKLWLKTEGDLTGGTVEEARAEALWDRVFSRWWSLQTGVRHDFGEGPSRTWAAFGVQGLAPYFLEVEATAYLGEGGRTAARFSGEYDLLLTQRLVLQPEIELSLHGKSDPENGIGSGLSDVQFGLRLRYELRREFAPYVGLVWTRRFAQTADFARAVGDDASDWQVLAGLRAWF
jgi:copper resistance protein B